MGNSEEMKKLMEKLQDMSYHYRPGAETNLAELEYSLEQLSDDIYVALKVQHGEEVAKSYLNLMGNVWSLLDNVKKN